MRARLFSVLGALTLIVGFLVGGQLVSAGPAAANYSGCWGRGPTVTDYSGTRSSTRYCHVYLGGNVELAGSNRGVTGYLNAGNNWFVCQHKFPGDPNPRVGSARNNWWLWTQADYSKNGNGRKYHGWGWFPATHVSGGGNYQPIPGLRTC